MKQVITPWDLELICAEEECLLIERERALRDIALLMRRYEITAAELEAHMLGGAGTGQS